MDEGFCHRLSSIVYRLSNCRAGTRTPIHGSKGRCLAIRRPGIETQSKVAGQTIFGLDLGLGHFSHRTQSLSSGFLGGLSVFARAFFGRNDDQPPIFFVSRATRFLHADDREKPGVQVPGALRERPRLFPGSRKHHKVWNHCRT